MTASPLAVSEVDIISEVVGSPDRDLDSGLFPHPNEVLREAVVYAFKAD